jgi:hypothetical protein
VAFGRFELGLSGLGRWQSMGESDPENGITIAGYDTEFVGVMVRGSIAP